MTDQCYHCGEAAKTREHAPPKCLFPADADKDYRVNLITVPSCDLHNSVKSGDDQYMMIYFAAGAHGLDYDKLRPHIDKTIRTIIRTPHIVSEYTNQFMIGKTDDTSPQNKVDWHAPENQIELLSNHKRICSFLASVARGVLFFDKEVQWDGAVLVIPHFLGVLTTDTGENITEMNSRFITPEQSSGSNKEIFYYTTNTPAQSDIAHVVDMCFYQQFKVTCFFVPKTTRERFESLLGHIEFIGWTE
ncbi:hypothetical protein [Pseudomonas jessenii]|uniref:hypothetical protein n=1 Tax=Pseudomonas jessenii TaxID=77298 RepID=UPI0032E3ABBB